MATVLLLGTFDTKGEEHAFAARRLAAAGVDVLKMDVGVLGEPALTPDLTAAEVLAAAGGDLDELRSAADRGAAVSTMAEAAAVAVANLYSEGRIDGALALGGTGGTSIAARAFAELPLGVPKFVVSTAASGDTSAYVAETDLVLMPSVVDVAGVNRISARVIANAAGAVAGAVTAPPVPRHSESALLAASMFGVTTPCVTTGREALERLGYEVLVFHMTGTGGRTMEALAAQGLLNGLFDVTTTELADELVGGVMSAGPQRLLRSGRLPRVVSVGALDMVNFGPRDTVPERFEGRNLYVHNPSVTLMRTTAEECHELGTRLASRLNQGSAPTVLVLPLRGVSAISTEGGPFHDPAADAALFEAVRANLDGSGPVDLVELDTDINDPEFARVATERLHDAIRQV